MDDLLVGQVLEASLPPDVGRHRLGRVVHREAPALAEREARPEARQVIQALQEQLATGLSLSAALERNKKYMRGEVAHAVNLKFAPDLRFHIDNRFEEAERIDKLLRSPEVRRDLEKDDE